MSKLIDETPWTPSACRELQRQPINNQQAFLQVRVIHNGADVIDVGAHGLSRNNRRDRQLAARLGRALLEFASEQGGAS